MATIAIGAAPTDLTVTLTTDTDFVATLTSSEPWDDGIGIELWLMPAIGDPVVWPATIDGTSATWTVDSADVATALETQPKLVRLHYIDADGNVLLWAKGRVYVA
jgi:hypothetical protein